VSFNQNIRHCGALHAQLIGRHGGGRCPIGKQFERLPNAVLSLPLDAAEVPIERARRVTAACERGGHEGPIVAVLICSADARFARTLRARICAGAGALPFLRSAK
jgi:hypothetical protein